MDADDTARAPMAKAILQSKELPWPMEIGSRGLVVLFPQPVNQKVEAVLARNGLSAKDHTTTPLTEYGKCYEALEFLIEGVLARLKEEEEQ